jgi:RND family efflux transporter MFP subunit
MIWHLPRNKKGNMRALIFPALLGASFAAWSAGPAYSIKTLAQLALYPQARAVAQIVPDNESRIAAEVSARIESIPVRVGQAVRKGDVLVKLDQRQFRLALQQAEGQVELLGNRYKLAQLQFEQTKSLHASQFVSAQALEQRRTELAVLDSELKIARHNVSQARLALDKTRLHAPFAGAVRERTAGEGELAAPGQPIVTLVEHARNELRARVPTRELAGLQAARSIVFRQAEQTYPAQIVRIAPVVDARAQTRDVTLKTDQPLVSGSAGELAWTSATPHLPAAYLQQRGDRLGVWIEEAGKPAFKPLPGAQAGRPVALDWPLQTRIVDEGRYALSAAQGDTAIAPAAK